MININEILQKVNYLSYQGSSDLIINNPVQANSNSFTENTITWLSDKNLDLLNSIDKGLVVCSKSATSFNATCNYLIVENPRLVFRDIIDIFFVKKQQPYISDYAKIDKSAVIGNNVTIGHNVVIEYGCTIGDDCFIDSNTIIKHDTIIYNNVKIGCNNTIGGIGFGYEKDLEGNYVIMPHLGNVIIKKFVEIGNNTCIDRAVIGSTIIEENVKIDNLVHIAHGVIIGKNSLIIANAMIGGSSVIGENVWFAPSASMLNKKIIGNNAVIGLAAVVVKNVKEGEVIVGNPGKPLIK
jgi:UDP-3-O-[3-hydroxymyristoyl] glucosamine N-acyltransferase